MISSITPYTVYPIPGGGLGRGPGREHLQGSSPPDSTRGIDRRLNGLAGPEYDATISFGLPIEPEDSQYGESWPR